jgi:hypothetical protein
MPVLLLKALLTPVLLGAAMFVTHRWGDRAGGWLLGLPIVSGPISIMLLLEHGQRFAVSAAHSTLAGFIAGGAFCACYAWTSERYRWPVSLGASTLALLGTAWVLAPLQLDWLRSALLVAAMLALLARTVGNRPPVERTSRTRKRDMVLQVLIASAVVVGLTTFAGAMGSNIAGLLAPLPVVAAVMATASIRRAGGGAANDLLRGAVAGSWGGAAFFAVTGAMLGFAAPVAVYATATAAALAASGVSARLRASA